MWELNHENIAVACEHLDIKLPVRVRVMEGGPQGMAGKYHGLGVWGPTTDVKLDSPAHHISLNGRMSSWMASSTLWHEMAHAAQCERYLPQNGNGQVDYETANREITKVFRDEMKAIRRRSGSTSKALTASYADVSFEKEARDAMDFAKELDLVKPVGDEPEATNLRDDKGRAGYRVDVYRDGVWNKKTKKRSPNIYVNTLYCVAKDEWAAKNWAREQCGLKVANSTANAYQMPLQALTPRGGE